MKVEIVGEFIKLSQFLKKIKIIDSGGEAKNFLLRHEVTINGQKSESRGSKIKIGDVVWVDKEVYYIIAAE
ncbi:RNA-binding S4 domain-containing protein [Mesomycoplasma lagogenitalium]|uniref:RNA-binding S4 domain-containing protein n=1 Tax=Mesomycoplasma lagogenitalium TaxID=171286 RepID=A0ABY8LW66_9BACT|nr:RNA-binding S4 domain-containing protein [Mesomycoplasma lagogenitalium]WGI36661.1 RNA-binding S4 domain-containing protein [Mesomycoplasma lagogenitalium]